MTLDRPGEGATMLRTFTLLLFCAGQLPKPIFWIQTETSPLPGCNVNILCHGWLQDLVFMLFKEGYAEPVDYQVPTGRVAIFSIANMTPESEGVYICRTHIQMLPTLWSEPSNPLKLIVADTFPKTWLLAQPSPVVQMGQNVSLWCRGPVDGVGLALYKKGEDKPLQLLDTTSIYDDTSFFLNNVTSSDAGIYSCHYLLSWKTSIRMTSHNTVELSLVLTLVSGLVADKPPKPSLSAWPSTVFKLGKAITLQCRVPHPVLEFCLEWEERAASQKFSVDGDFIISNVEGKGTGTYSCSYRIEAHPNIWSHRSEPLKLMGPAGFLTWNHVLNETIRLFLIIQLVALLFVVLWIRWKCRRLRIREAWLLGTAQGVTMLFILTALLCCGEYKGVGKGPGQKAGVKSRGGGGKALAAISFAGLCTGVLTEETDILPKPVISASPPIRGQELQIRCKGWLAGMGFALYKEGVQDPVQRLGAVGREGFFTIRRMEDKDEGNYSCRTHTEKRPFKWSEPSEPLELVIKEMYPKPFFETWTSPVVTPGSRVTFNCSTPHQQMSFILYKDGSEVASSDRSWAGLGASAAHFLIISVGIGDGGNYSCRYYDFAIWSEPSDLVELVVTEFYPKPTLLAQPGPVVLPGKNVTLRCQGAFQDMRFALLQEGIPGPLQFRSASGNSADFLLHTVGAEDSGNYSCVYYETTMSNRGSYLSKPLMIWVTDTFPKPRLFAEPSSVVPVGQNVTLWCQGPVHGVGYILHKEVEATSVQLWGSTSNDGAFPITNVSGASIGRYSCCYHPDWTSLIKIQPSNTLELIVTDKPPKPSLSASPSTVFRLGKDITLQCRGPLPGVEFVLEHDGEEAPQQFSEDGDFVINNVEGKGIGNYSCSYRLQAYPDIWSEPSDTLELVGAAGPAAQECTVGNIVRSTLIVVVVVALGVVLAIEWKKWPRLRTRGSETDGRDQTIALEECNQEGDLGTNTNSPSSVSQGTSVEQPVPI
ncbi:hypothetical protein G4228_019028 [Cervus hanglu yarkandensis]|nr:hypothetical protein G4228_019028 [Cervus hanglu yarkandensis]